MTAWALYRLPHQRQVTLVGDNHAMPVGRQSLLQWDGKPAFVIAPFHTVGGQPIVMLHPDVLQRYKDASSVGMPQDITLNILPAGKAASITREGYQATFETFKQQLTSGKCHKLVLARTLLLGGDETRLPLLQLFQRACQRYPEAFVTLFTAPQCGTWLVATPEMLLQRENDATWHTMALAGTMQAGSAAPWSDKNKHEQQLVASYIAQRLDDSHATLTHQEGPHTVRAGQLVHLRTDFGFTLPHEGDEAALIHSLHPTPAVCGLPCQQARDFILDHEGINRAYYSGYCGPMLIGGDTAVFVTLRCLQLVQEGCLLYAGGGILPASQPEQEWQETADKLQTMASLLK